MEPFQVTESGIQAVEDKLKKEHTDHEYAKRIGMVEAEVKSLQYQVKETSSKAENLLHHDVKRTFAANIQELEEKLLAKSEEATKLKDVYQRLEEQRKSEIAQLDKDYQLKVSELDKEVVQTQMDKARLKEEHLQMRLEKEYMEKEYMRKEMQRLKDESYLKLKVKDLEIELVRKKTQVERMQKEEQVRQYRDAAIKMEQQAKSYEEEKAKIEKAKAEAAKLIDEYQRVEEEWKNKLAQQDKDYRYAAVEHAINSRGKLDHTVMQGVFLGPARSGKSSLIKRLLKEKLNSTSPSTGAAEKVIKVNVKKSSSIATSIFESSWLRLTYNSEAVRLMMFIAKTYKNEPRRATQHYSDYHPMEMPAGYVDPTQTLETALHTDGMAALHKYLDGSWSLYLSDIGGQMEFQEMLPLLVSGPSLYFIVFPLNRDLNELFTIEYHLPDGQRSQPYQSSLTLKEAILQSLATIAAMGTFVYKGKGKDVQLKPKVLLVGSHKDMLDPATAQKKIEEIDCNLQQIVTSTSHYDDDILVFATESQLIFTVNNLAEDDSDFALIRSRVSAVAKRIKYQMSIPTHWLVFSLVIRNLTGRVISYSECLKVAQQCGIDSEEELNDALWFLHTKMGVIRHFPHGDLSNIVITDPQLLFDKITELILKTFTFENAGKLLSDEFKKKGIFNSEDFEQISATSDSLLTHSRFIELLKHLRIVAPFLDGRKFLIPCVLAHADKALHLPRQHSAVPTLAIVFDCGYCPKGVTGTMIKYLMTNEMKSGFDWKLQPDQIFRDQVSFLVGPSLITLCLYPTHFEVVYVLSTESTEVTCSIQDTCHDVYQSIQKAIQTVSEDMGLTHHCEVSFYCSFCKSHIAELRRNKSSIPCALWCDKMQKTYNLPNGFHCWLEASPNFSHEKPKLTESSNTLSLFSAYPTVFRLASEWKNLGIFLKVDIGTLDEIEHDYKKANDCLREMLSAWLRQKDPSWYKLVHAVQLLDPTLAEEISKTYCNS